MALRITIDLFSGRPNPVIILDDNAAAELVERLRPVGRLKGADAEAPPESILGYRGVVIEQTGGEPVKNLPDRFRVVDGKLIGHRFARRPADPHVEDFICGNAGPVRLIPLEAQVRTGLLKRIEERRTIDWSKWPPKKQHWPVRIRCRCAPLYEPDWWNDAAAGGARQYNNNCYNYATNYRTDTFAQPGLASGQIYPLPISCAGVRPAALRDDLIDNPQADNHCPDEGHLVALVVGPGFDFHWYRKGRNGLWTHKPGGTPVTNVDNSGAFITDPRTANRDGYTDFCTFMTVMHGHIKIR
jgi:hypothetical protein